MSPERSKLMKKRILAAFLAVVMLVSVVPVSVFADSSGTPAAQAEMDVKENTNQSDGVVMRKSVMPHTVGGVPDGTVDVIIEAYTTGVVRQTTTSVPTDIVLVLDVSGSMKDAQTVTTYDAVNGSSQNRMVGFLNFRTFYGFSNTSAKYYYNINIGTDAAPHYVPLTRQGADSSNYDYYRYYDANDRAVYVYPRLSNNPSETREFSYPVVQFYRQNTSTTNIAHIDALKSAVDSFIETTHQKNAEIAAEGKLKNLTDAQIEALQHRIAVVKFADDSYYGGSASLTEGNHKNDDDYNYTEVVKNLTVADGDGHEALLAAVNALTPGGATSIDYGLTLAQMVLAPNNAGTAQRNKVVLVFSDGEPNHSSGFNDNVANTAINITKSIKQTAKVYSISVAPETNVNDTTSKLNKFFHYVSSNYPNASDLNTPGANGSAAAGYYLVPSGSESLSMIFQAIAENIESPTIELGESAEIVDTMSTFFTIPNGTKSVSLYKSDRVKNTDGTWGWSDAYTDSGLSCTVQGKTVEVHGFDYDENYVSDTPRTKNGKDYYGTALIIMINATPDYNMIDTHASSVQGGKIPSNDGAANLLNTAGAQVATVESPYIQANTVSYQYTDPVTNQTVTYATYYRLAGGKQSVISATPLIPGYTFGGWSTTDASVAADGTYTMPKENIVFNGTFTANKHDVTYKITGYNPGATAPAGQTGVDFGTDVTVAADLTYPGYTFTGWQSTNPTITADQSSFTMPDRDVELIGYFTANTGIPYKTIHYIENLDGTYSVKETVNGTGTTDATVTAATRVYEGFTLDTSVTGATVTGVAGTVDTVSSGKVTADGQFTMHQFHKRNKYTVTYAYEGSAPAGAPAVPQTKEYYHGQIVTVEPHAAQDAVKDHTFAGWHTLDKTTVTDNTVSFEMPVGNITLYGHFSVKENVPFHIHHYLQNADGSYPTTPNYTGSSHGVAGTVEYASEFVRTIPGYTYDSDVTGSVTQGTVSEDPELILKLYYTVNKYDVKYEFENAAPAGVTPPAGLTDVAFGTTVTVADPVTVEGYIFSGWRIKTPAEGVIKNGKFTMPASDVVLVGSFTARTNTPYRIEYYWQNVEGDGYTLHEWQNLTGTTDSTVTIPEKNYTGFTFNGSASGTKLEGTVTADGKLVLKRYYDRNTYQVKYAYEASSSSISNLPPLPEDTTAYRYGATVTVKPDVSKTDYTFIGWYSKVSGAVTAGTATFTMPIPANGQFVTLYGDFSPNTDVQFHVKHYLQNADGSYPAAPAATDTVHGQAGATVKDSDYIRPFPGYTFAPDADDEGTVQTGLVLELYYTVNKYKVTYEYIDPVPDGVIPARADLGTLTQYNVPYGTKVNVAAPATADGYVFSGWMIKERSTFIDENGQFVMPDKDVVLVGSFEARTNNQYKVEYYWQNTEGDGYTLYETDTYHNGVTGATVTAPEKTYTGLTLDKTVSGTVESGTVTPDGQLTLKLYYVRDTYTVEYKYESDVSGAPALPTTATYRFGQKVDVEKDAVLEHYDFHGWYTKTSAFAVNAGMASFTMPAENLTLWGEFKRIEGVHYKVEHYLLDANGNPAATPILTEEFEDGIAGETVTGTPKKASVDNRFTGYVHDPAAAGSVLSGEVVASSDPNYPLTLKLYYKRNTFKVIYQYEGVLPANRSPLPAVVDAVYLSEVTIAANATADGYTFSGWTIQSPAGVSVTEGKFEMPAHDVTLVGSFNINPPYVVEYWLQKTDHSGYVKDENASHTHTAPIGETVEAHSMTFEGYTENTTHKDRVPYGEIPASGTLVLKLFYDLNDYKVTYVFESPSPANAILPQEETKHFGDIVTTPTPTLEGYTFSGWTSAEVGSVAAGQDFTMPAKNVVLKGKFIAGNANYTVEHYLMNDSGNYDNVTPYTETKSGVVGDSVRANAYQTYLNMGAKIDADKTRDVGKWEGVVSATTPLVLKLYYSRDAVAKVVYHYVDDLTEAQWRALGWPDLPTDTKTYYTGATVTALDVIGTSPDKAVFEGWFCSDPTILVAPGGTFTMPALTRADQTIHLYGKWVSTEPQEFTVKYFVDGIEQTHLTQIYPLNTSVAVMDKLENTSTHAYSAWSAPASVTTGVDVVLHADGTFTMTEHGEVHIFCTTTPIAPVERFTVRYYLNDQLYWEGGYEAFQRHFMLDAPALPAGYYFSGWSVPRTLHGLALNVLYNGLGQAVFTMPGADVVIYGTTGLTPIPDGTMKIRKVLQAPAGFTGDGEYTFRIYQVIGETKTLVRTETVKVNAKTGEGESPYFDLPQGNNYLVEEVGAGVPGYALTTVATDESGNVIPYGTPVTVKPRVTPTVITFTNTYADLSLETRDHFGYIIGYQDDTVRPEANITRAEVATIFFRLLTDAKRAEYWSKTNDFTDVAADAWYNNAISTLAKAGALSGYEDGTFRPDQPITRAELVKIAMSFYGTLNSSSDAFNDIGEHWAAAFINGAADLGFVNGYGDETFQPDRYVTRAEAIKIINRTLNRAPDKDHLLSDMITWIDNMDTDAWYYAEIQEATNSHTYTWDKTSEIWEKIRPVRDWSKLEKAWSEANDGE